MSKVIAVAGKGGTGKTTFSALLIHELRSREAGPILAVDADANYNLGEALGMEVEKTIADLTDDFFKNRTSIPAGMPKEAYLEILLNGLIVESKGLDLLVMGRPEGAGCYCYVNNILKAHLDKLIANYPYTIVDNEAGMEHLSRRTTPNIDLMFVVSDCSIKALRAAGRIARLPVELDLNVGRMALVLTKSRGPLDPAFKQEAESLGLDLAAVLPEDSLVYEQDLRGQPVVEVAANSKAAAAVREIVEHMILTDDAHAEAGVKYHGATGGV